MEVAMFVRTQPRSIATSDRTPEMGVDARRLVAVLAVVAGGAVVLGLALGWVAMLVGAGCAVLGFVFVAARGLALAGAATTAGCRLGGVRGVRIFVEGVAVEAATWPGKLWADGYRAAALPEGSVVARGRALLAFRGATMLGSALVLAAVALLVGGDGLGLVWAAGAIVVLLLAALRMRRRGKLAGAGITGWCVLGSTADALAMALAAWGIGGIAPAEVLPALLLASWLGAASGVPLGIGVTDAALVGALTAVGGAETGPAVLAALVYRSTGPLVTLGCGAALIGVRGWVRVCRMRHGTSGVPLDEASAPARGAGGLGAAA